MGLVHPKYGLTPLGSCLATLYPIHQIWLLLNKSHGKCFGSNENVTVAVNGYFADFPESYFRGRIHLSETRWTKCIGIKGDNIEK